MIVTVTLNPSLDRTMDVAVLRAGQVNRALSTHLHPGGKGVNVTRALLANGVPSRTVLPVAGPEGDQLVQLLTAEGVAAVVVPVSGRTRSNVTIADRDGTVTKVNEPGTPLAPADLEEVLDRALTEAPAGSWLVLCGSLPPGTPADQYATMTRRATAHGVRVAVDTSGEALRRAVDAAPDLVKPNAEELAEAVGRPLRSRAEVVEAAHELRRRGVRRVLVSLGGAGALLVDDDGVTLGESVAVAPRSTVGAGDAFLAGFLAAEESTTAPAGPERSAASLRQALAWGAAAVQLPGSQMPGPGDIDLASASLLRGPSVGARLVEPLVGTG
ncbi:1-phosphofructokinase [Actinotalea sp. Marseille-Q4924]|uniref:1-phosphofructokinase n=1 Tax=Actinotalea sp. Marseille-Q4924 TaxID=2866571 RepID=UPI001CE41BFC|nr:1-phosphofructokinase [Actinotalea sp. Marseille-Q4924]